MAKQSDNDKLSELLANFNGEMLGDDFAQQFEDNTVRVERILLDMVRPDPLQPRRVLPDRVYQAFHNDQLTPSQALREMTQTAQVAARQNGRPFSNLLELLPDPERDDESGTQLTPEEAFLRDLVNLAVTIRDDGQVNPLTVVDVTEGVTRLYRIETGERRYWATWLLRDFIPGYEGDGMIPCIVVPHESASAFRQAKENTARSGLSAIAMARQAALLLMWVHGYEMPNGPVPPDFYRQALDLDMRGKREYTEAILSAMGGIRKSHFSAIKSLLRLSNEAMEIADRHDLEEGKLRHVVSLPAEYHVEIVRQIVDFDLTSKQVKELCRDDATVKDEDPLDRLPPNAVKMARVYKVVGETSAHDLARALVQQEGDSNIAIARLRAMRTLILEAEKLLDQE
jgi:hypothetical protein